MAQLVADRSLAGTPVAAVSLGGAMLGGVPEHEARAILQLAAERGVRLVDTSSAYGDSERRIGAAAAPGLAVATKFGNPCALNGHTHDYSVAHARACLQQSVSALGGKRIACLQLHSPPEWPSPVANRELVAALNGWVREGAIGGWGASVHTVNGGQILLSAGASMLQVPYSVLQQEHAPLLAMAMLRGAGVLVQSALCQGWLTDAGARAARRAPRAARHRVAVRVALAPGCGDTGRSTCELLRRVVAATSARAHHPRGGIAELALRFAAHAPGATSALAQVSSAGQLARLLEGGAAPSERLSACQDAPPRSRPAATAPPGQPARRPSNGSARTAGTGACRRRARARTRAARGRRRRHRQLARARRGEARRRRGGR